MVNKMEMSKRLKTSLFFGFICIFMGLSFSLIYQYVLRLCDESIIPICLGFSSGNFIIIMGIIREIFHSDKD